jgi:hypothetical protein
LHTGFAWFRITVVVVMIDIMMSSHDV